MSSSMNPLFIKAGVAAVSAAVLDRLVCGEQDMYQNAYFGLSTAAGVGIGSYISSLTPAMLPDSPGLYTGKGVMDRAFEVIGGTASAAVIGKYLTKGETGSFTTKLMVVVASDFIAEYAKDYLTSAPLAYLQ